LGQQLIDFRDVLRKTLLLAPMRTILASMEGQHFAHAKDIQCFQCFHAFSEANFRKICHCVKLGFAIKQRATKKIGSISELVALYRARRFERGHQLRNSVATSLLNNRAAQSLVYP